MYLQVKVIPKARKTEFIEWLKEDGSDTAKIKLKAAPEKGAANKDLLHFLAKSCHLKKEDVKIISGHTSTRKLIKLPEQTKLPW